MRTLCITLLAVFALSAVAVRGAENETESAENQRRVSSIEFKGENSEIEFGRSVATDEFKSRFENAEDGFYDEYEDENNEVSDRPEARKVLGESTATTTTATPEDSDTKGVPTEVFLNMRNLSEDDENFRTFKKRNDPVDLQASASDNVGVAAATVGKDDNSSNGTVEHGWNSRAYRDARYPLELSIVAEEPLQHVLLPYQQHSSVDAPDLSDCARQGEWRPIGEIHIDSSQKDLQQEHDYLIPSGSQDAHQGSTGLYGNNFGSGEHSFHGFYGGGGSQGSFAEFQKLTADAASAQSTHGGFDLNQHLQKYVAGSVSSYAPAFGGGFADDGGFGDAHKGAGSSVLSYSSDFGKIPLNHNFNGHGDHHVGGGQKFYHGQGNLLSSSGAGSYGKPKQPGLGSFGSISSGGGGAFLKGKPGGHHIRYPPGGFNFNRKPGPSAFGDGHGLSIPPKVPFLRGKKPGNSWKSQKIKGGIGGGGGGGFRRPNFDSLKSGPYLDSSLLGGSDSSGSFHGGHGGSSFSGPFFGGHGGSGSSATFSSAHNGHGGTSSSGAFSGGHGGTSSSGSFSGGHGGTSSSGSFSGGHGGTSSSGAFSGGHGGSGSSALFFGGYRAPGSSGSHGGSGSSGVLTGHGSSGSSGIFLADHGGSGSSGALLGGYGGSASSSGLSAGHGGSSSSGGYGALGLSGSLLGGHGDSGSSATLSGEHGDSGSSGVLLGGHGAPGHSEGIPTSYGASNSGGLFGGFGGSGLITGHKGTVEGGSLVDNTLHTGHAENVALASALTDQSYIGQNVGHITHEAILQDASQLTSFTCGKNHDHGTNYHTASFQVSDDDHGSQDVLQYQDGAHVIIHAANNGFDDVIHAERKQSDEGGDPSTSATKESSLEIITGSIKGANNHRYVEGGNNDENSGTSDQIEEPTSHSFYREKFPSTENSPIQFEYGSDSEKPQIIKELEELSSRFQLDLDSGKYAKGKGVSYETFFGEQEGGDEKSNPVIHNGFSIVNVNDFDINPKEERYRYEEYQNDGEVITEYPYYTLHQDRESPENLPVVISEHHPHKGDKPKMHIPPQRKHPGKQYEVHENSGEKQIPTTEIFPPQKFPRQFHNPMPNLAGRPPKEGSKYILSSPYGPYPVFPPVPFKKFKKYKPVPGKLKYRRPILVRRPAPITSAPVVRVSVSS